MFTFLFAQTLFAKPACFILQLWMDELMVWDPDKYYGIKQLRIPVSKIWLPDLILVNR